MVIKQAFFSFKHKLQFQRVWFKRQIMVYFSLILGKEFCMFYIAAEIFFHRG